ncbi:MAG: dipeptidase [Myxococcales bacterium]
MTRWLTALAVFVLIVVLLLPRVVDRTLNRVLVEPPYEAPPWARELARDSVDLHADPLLWGRDLLSRGRGDVDVPRLAEVGAALQVFGVVTHSPAGMNVTANRTHAFDTIAPLVLFSLWPARTWTSRRERALYEADRLQRAVAGSDGRLVFVRSRVDLEMLVQARAHGSRSVGALLALEGSQALEGDLRAIDTLYAAGFRMMAPTHFVDTDISGSAHGAQKGGLTPLGREWLKRLEAKKIIVDLAHASPQTVDEVLASAKRPVVVSHTGVKGTCDSPRNLSDAQLHKLGANRALVGIGYWKEATCGTDAHAVARAVRHAADVIGVAHVALGSDFDGAVVQPFDVTGLPLIAAAMREEKFSDDQIRLVFSQNALRFFAETLP